MKNNKVLYNKIMESVSKEVKKALNESEYDSNGEIDIQTDTKRWCEAVSEYLWDHTDNTADPVETLGLFATLVYLDQLDDEEIKQVAESIMNQVDVDYDTPPVDEVFFEAVAEKLKDEASDWCAEIVKDWKLN